MLPSQALYFFENSKQLQLMTKQTGQIHASQRLQDLLDLHALIMVLDQGGTYMRAELAGRFGLFLAEQQQHDAWTYYRFEPLDEGETNWRQFVNTMKTMYGISLRLSSIQNKDELIQQAIKEAQQHLFIDRLGFLMIDGERMLGTWGTNEDGEIEDCRAFSKPIPAVPWVEKTLASRDHVACWENVDLVFKGRIVGHGWNAMAGLWDGDQCIGWIACDNLIRKRPMQPWLLEIIAHFGQMLGHLIARRDHLEQLRNINQDLEQRVTQRTEQLEQAQKELIEAEKLAALGGLVAGIAHEINTPIGVAVTANSHLEEQCRLVQQQIHSQELTRSGLSEFLQDSLATSQMINLNLERGKDLISSFKQLAVDQSYDHESWQPMRQLAQNLATSFHHQLKAHQVQLQLDIDPKLEFLGIASHLNQILTNLIQNSLLHAFQDQQPGLITLSAKPLDNGLCLHYQDNGRGVAADQQELIFEPFYTTRRGQGGTGLGLNIVFNLIKKMQGSIRLTHSQPGLGFELQLPLICKTNNLDQAPL